MKVSNKKLKEIYHLMKRSRAFEERAVLEYRKGRIPGFVHTSIGQEAISSAVCGLLEKDDYVLSTHRGHGDIISKGARFDKMMAELFARQTGYCKGKGGSMHIIAPECNVLGCSGIVGATVPWASGVALACKMKKWDRVTVCFLGDGTTFQGAFHEGINIAAAFDLPVIFVCQNNKYAISTYWKDYTKLPNIAARAQGYGIPGISVDGMDAKAVAEVAGDAIERARKGEGPTFIEGVTYRYHGHGQYDPGTTYRTKEEVEEWKKKDPINKLYSLLQNEKLITEKENREFEESLSRELDEAVEFALKSPEPKIEEACTDIYAEDL
ncbi:MAG: thiamine pyrophosphate-dependent dehydrogenase E1 component subunit alpha [Deltaproteobacteria bacterium]|nr:thiamine pyrophosphate-dependent dehydrogenase E1 component subunit alpha [Deltaproteobacteria bacterium]